jgi:hypothetical protein
MSITKPSGFEMLSAKMIFVFSVSARLKLSVSVGSTKVQPQPKERLNVSRNWLVVPP